MLFVLVVILFFFVLVFGCIPGNADAPKTPSKTPTKDEEKASPLTDVGEDPDLAARQIRFNKQCWLIDSYKDLIGIFDSPEKKLFEHFSTITGDPAEITSQLVSKPSIQPLFQIKPYQMALLQPRVRLFVMKRNSSNKMEPVELKFAQSLGKTSVGEEDYADLFKSTNLLGAGAGIKSFSYELAGVNPAEADKLIEANLVLYFQSVADLFAVRGKFNNQELRFVDLINYGSSERKAKDQRRIEDARDFRIKAVVGWSEPHIAEAEREGIISKELAAALVQSKVTLHLQLIDHTVSFRQEGNVELEIKYMAALQQTLESSRMDLFWTPVDLISATLQQQSTSIGLGAAQVRQARVEQTLRRLEEYLQTQVGEILDPQEIEAIEELLQSGVIPGKEGSNTDLGLSMNGVSYDKLYSDIQVDQSANPRLGETAFEKFVGNVSRRARGKQGWQQRRAKEFVNRIRKQEEARVEDAITRADDARQKLKKLKASRRDVVYRRLVELMIKDENLYVAQVTKEEVGIFNSKLVGNTEITNTTRERTQSASESDPKRKKSIQPKKADKKKVDLVQSVKQSDGRPADKIIESSRAKTIKQIESGSPTVDIHFFFFGDLVDTAIKILKEAQVIKYDKSGKPNSDNTYTNREAIEALKEFSILLGPVSFKDKKKGEVEIINVSQIPISFELFQQWWLEKVIKAQKESYELRDFLKDAIKELVSPALGQGCFQGYAQPGKMSMLPLSIPSAAKDQQRIPKFGARCRLQDLKNKRALPLRPETVNNTQIRRLNDYLYFFMADEFTKKRTVDAEEDFSNGIYHLRIGEDRGIVKSVEFHQADIQFLKETRLTNDADIKDGFLRKKYDATIKTIGNTLFAPGQYIYIHPTVPGATSEALVRDQLQKLGLGGYYLITKVFHIVSQDYYQTEIEAKWESYGVSKNDKANKPLRARIIGDQTPCKQQGDGSVKSTFDLSQAVKSAQAAAAASAMGAAGRISIRSVGGSEGDQ